MTTDELKKLLDKLIRKVWKNKGTPQEIDRAITEFFASEYWAAIEKGYGVNIENVDFNTPDYEMLRSLEKSVYQFSAAKNYAQMKAMSEALIGEDGKLRSYTQFRQAALEVNNLFVNQWMQAEYNFAVASSQSASQWVRIQATKDILPLLRYKTAGDERVRPEHQDMEDITLPVEHPFWDLYYPPNGWNCRCDVIQLDSGAVTPDTKIVYPDKMPAIFRYNPGKTGVAFPPGSPYYDGLPDDIRKQATDLWSKNGWTND